MASIGNLDVNINTSGVAKGVADLDRLTAAGTKAEGAVEGLADATQALGKGAPAIGAAARALADAGKSADTAGSAASTLNSALGGIGATAQKATNSFGAFAAGQKLSAYQSQQLSFQLNDLFVQIASGQSPLTALIQQGSQLNGTFGGLGGTLRAIGSLFTLTNVAIGAAALAVGGLGYAYYKGAQQSEDFRKAVLLTGNAAGVTESRFNSLVASISESTRTTAGSTRETLQTLVASGRFAGEALTSAVTATQGLAKVTGESTDKIAASFVKGSQSVGTFAATLNDQYNFLTATQLSYIKTLADQGREQEALVATFSALNTRIGTVDSNVGLLGRTFNTVKSAALGLADAIAGIGRAQTTGDKIATIQAQIEALDTRKSDNPARAAARKKVLQDELAILQQAGKEEEQLAGASAKRVQSERASTAFLELQDKYANAAVRREKERAVVLERAKAAGKDVNSKEVKDLLAEVDRRNKDEKSDGLGRIRTDANAAARETLEGIKSAGQAQLDEYQSQDRVLEARRTALLIRDQAYYDEKLRIARESTAAQIATLTQENTFLNSRTLTGADASDRDRQVIANKTKIAQLNTQLATTEQINGIQAKRAADIITEATNEARVSAEQYLATQQRNYDLTLAGLALSDREQASIQAIAAIRERYESQRQSIAGDLRRGQITQDRYNAELAIINEFQTKAIASYQAYSDRTVELAKYASIGANRAFGNYLNDAANASKQSEELFTSAFSGIEDALVRFSTTGKLSFKDLATSIIADIVRIQIKAAAVQALGGANGASLFSTVTKFLGFGTSSQGVGGTNFLSPDGSRARGGPVSAGGLYRVNENGPELLSTGGKQYLMMGGQSGSVTPNGGGSGSGVNVIINNNGDATATTSEQPNAEGGVDLIVTIENAIATRAGKGQGSLAAVLRNKYGMSR